MENYSGVDTIAQVDHAARLIRRFREFVRTGKAEMAPTSPDFLISETIALAKPLLAASNIAVTTEVHAEVPDVMVDRLQLELVLLNLITNSVEAISQSGRSAGRVTLEARSSSEVGYVEISVRDDGPGFAPEILDGAAPFATTKAEGTGIGLTLSRTIIERHHGQLILSNTPNGACIVITLPKASGAHRDGD